jgi:hypothetical protein
MHAGNNLEPVDLYIDFETEVKPYLGRLIGGCHVSIWKDWLGVAGGPDCQVGLPELLPGSSLESFGPPANAAAPCLGLEAAHRSTHGSWTLDLLDRGVLDCDGLLPAGVGGFGKVYEAMWRGQRVAVKVQPCESMGQYHVSGLCL